MFRNLKFFKDQNSLKRFLSDMEKPLIKVDEL